VSFVIPTRNQARFIRRCIDSCLAQRLEDAEILVQDGLSTDGTQDVLRSYGSRISWVSERDSGQADAVNRCVARATGDLVAWINSDDYYPDDRCLPEVLAALRAPEDDVAIGDGLVVDVDGRPIRPYRNRAFSSARDVLVSPIGPSQPATFFRRSLFLACGGLRPELHYALDYELWLRMFPRARRIRRVERTLACMTFHADAKSTRSMLPQIREVARVKREHARALGIGLADRARLEAGMAALWTYAVAVRAGLRRAG
jgi:glycosyltransferase involved in cell wall biosynthesis